VAPAPALGTEAVFPVEPPATVAGAVIVASTFGLTVTVADPVAEPMQWASPNDEIE